MSQHEAELQPVSGPVTAYIRVLQGSWSDSESQALRSVASWPCQVPMMITIGVDANSGLERFQGEAGNVSYKKGHQGYNLQVDLDLNLLYA